MKPQIPENEAERIKALESYEILDTVYEQEYDDITLLASQICGTPIAAISLVDKERQWFKSKIGMDLTETPRDDAFCAHGINYSPEQLMIVSDALTDERFAKNPFVVADPHVRFYAGAPLVTPDNHSLGMLCVFDHKPRHLSKQQLASLQALARQVTMKLELRKASLLLQNANQKLHDLSLTDDLTELNNRRGFMMYAEHQLKLFKSRRAEAGLWLLMADLDKLKPINDTYGHEAGSAAIKAAGMILSETFRETDVVARLGGDEFAVLIINALDSVEDSIAARLQKNIDAYNLTGGKPYQVSISFGIIKVEPENKLTIEELLKLADEKMYEQKISKKVNR